MSDDIDDDIELLAVELDQLKQGPMGSEIVRGDREIQFQVARMAYKALDNLGLTGKYKVKVETGGSQAEVYFIPVMEMDLESMRERLRKQELPCGHTMADWLGLCFACLKEKPTNEHQEPKD